MDVTNRLEFTGMFEAIAASFEGIKFLEPLLKVANRYEAVQAILHWAAQDPQGYMSLEVHGAWRLYWQNGTFGIEWRRWGQFWKIRLTNVPEEAKKVLEARGWRQIKSDDWE